MYQEIKTPNYQDYMAKFKINSLLAKVLDSFNYDEADLASFFSPLDKFTLPDEIFKPIKNVLTDAIKQQKSVFIFGDYDCDGICATTIMKKILDKMGIKAGFYIPSRINEGYGLNITRLQQAKAKNYDILITVDNGVSCQEQLSWAKQQGMTTIVTDHHIISNEVNADYFLHPALLEKDYQYLCGTGVVYLLACYLGLEDEACKVLAMLATISDVMSLKGANIKIVNDGLDVLNKQQYPNILMMGDLEFPIDENDIGFKVVPKINAVGRVSEETVSLSNQVVYYLLSNDKLQMNNIYINVINFLNEKRKQLSKEQYALCKAELKEDAKINFIYVENLHVGILGLLASRFADETNKVSIVLTNHEGNIIGSVRSVNQIDIMSILDGFRSQTIKLGGHALAAGITIGLDKLTDFRNFMFEKCANLPQESIIDYLRVDINELTKSNLDALFNYRPFGQDRRLPLMMVEIDNSNIQHLKTKTQLKWHFDDIDFLSFNNEGYDSYKDLTKVTLVGKLQINKFRGRTRYQMMVSEIIK